MFYKHSNLDNLTGRVKRKVKKNKWRCSQHASHLLQTERHSWLLPPLTSALNCVLDVPFQVAVNGANLQNVFMLLTLEPLLARSPFLVLHVRRNNLVGDALRELSIHSDIDLKKPLKVSPSMYFSKYLPNFSFNSPEVAMALLLKLWTVAIHYFFRLFYKNLIISCQVTT